MKSKVRPSPKDKWPGTMTTGSPQAWFRGHQKESSIEVKAQQSPEMDEGQRSPQQPIPSGLVTAFPSLSHLYT